MVTTPTLREMLNAGVHFGHKTARWNPKMDKFIFIAKSGVHVINLEKTEEELIKATTFLRELASSGKIIVFVGSKKQASEIVKKAAKDCGMPYVNFRWLGGTLTNFSIIKGSIDKFNKEKDDLENGRTLKMTKREQSELKKRIEKNEKILGGIAGLTKKPDALILIGAHDQKNALREAKTVGIPVVALVDTNTDPTQVDYPIPANDDATKSLELFATYLSRVIKENKSFAKAKENNQ